MSCVRNGPGIGFVKDWRRMNVSLTRARYGLVIVGNRGTFSQYSADWTALCTHFAGKKAIIKENGETVRANTGALLQKSRTNFKQ